MFQRCFILICLLALLSVPGAADAQQAFRRGDVDGDGCVNPLVDAIYSLYSLFLPGWPQPACADAADANDDGMYMVADALLLLNYGYIAGSPPPPEPGPFDCGLDPTDDALDCQLYDCTPCQVSPPDPGFILSLGLVTGVVGTQAAMPVHFDNTGGDVAAWSFGVCHDSAAVDIALVDLGAATQVVNNGEPPYYVGLNLFPGGGWTVAVIVDFLGSATLPAGTDHELFVAHYDLLAVGEANVSFCDILGPPVLGLPTVITVLTSTGETVNPVLAPGLITVDPDVNPGSFIRGDTNGDESLTMADYVFLQQYLFSSVNPIVGTGGPLGCGPWPAESGDINDNEFITIADLLMFRQFLLCGGGAIPGPNSCGDDPDDTTQGFDEVDPDYLVSAFTVEITGPVDEVRDVSVLLQVLSPTPVNGVSLGLSFGSSLTLADVPLTVAPGVNAGFIGALVDGNNVVVAGGSTACAVPMLPGSPSFQALGTLHLKLAPLGVFPPVQWVPEALINGELRRTTIVDDSFQDHNPFMVAGQYLFARGNANNLDAFVDIADPVYILGFLFNNFPLDCEDAADGNNDGRLDIADPIYLLSSMFAGGSPIPPPFPMCGYDIDIDDLDCVDGAICP
ncbi:MAG: hypothetical protein ACE5GW_02670 [Planctomycetota bacterium]